MGGEESKTKSSEATNFQNIKNSSIHFDNIYNFHQNHSKQISELNTKVEVGVLSIIGLLMFILISIIFYIIVKKLRNKYKTVLENKAKDLALKMVENNQNNIV